MQLDEPGLDYMQLEVTGLHNCMRLEVTELDYMWLDVTVMDHMQLEVTGLDDIIIYSNK